MVLDCYDRAGGNAVGGGLMVVSGAFFLVVNVKDVVIGPCRVDVRTGLRGMEGDIWLLEIYRVVE